MKSLTVNSVTKSFGGIVAVDQCDISIETDSLIGLIGPNGAGKTTIFNLVSGLIAPDSGTICLGEDRIDGEPPYRICRSGISRSFQIPREWGGMTVMENLLLSKQGQTGESPLPAVLNTSTVQEEEAENTEQAAELLELVNLYEKRNDPASDLSVGQKQLLEIARCLMTDPQILLLDEPFAGVAPPLIPEISESLETLQRDNDLTIVIIEHNIEALSDIVSEMIVMNNGSVLRRGEPGAVQDDEVVREAYLGGEV